MSEFRVRSTTGFVADTIPFSNVDGPGNRFVVFLQGCNFDCIACHNPQTIPGTGAVPGHHPEHRSVDDVVAEIRRAAPYLAGVTVSGGEATLQPDFLLELFATLGRDPELQHLSRLVDSNGACELALWDELAPVMEGAMIDLKCFDARIHREMTGESNAAVVASIEHLVTLDRLYEVRLLLIAGVNDHEALLGETARWLASLDPSMRVKLIGFRSHGVRPHDPPLVEPTGDDLQSAVRSFGSVADFEITVV